MNIRQNRKSHHMLEGLIHEWIKLLGQLLDAQRIKDGPANTVLIKFFLVTFAILTFMGEVCMDMVFRKNPKRDNIEFVFALLGCAGIMYFAVFLFNEDIAGTKDNWGYQDSFLVFAILYGTLAVIVAIDTIRHWINRSTEDNRSTLSVLAKEGWEEDRIRILGEPLLVLILGAVSCAFIPVAGLPLMYCTFSVWIHALKDRFSKDSMHQQIDESNKKTNNNDDFKVIKL